MKINAQVEAEINRCVQALRNGAYIIFPGETGWCIGCDAKKELVNKIITSSEYYQPSLLIDDGGRLNKYVTTIPDQLWDLVTYSERPLDIVLGNVVNLPEEVMTGENETTFRVVKDAFSLQLTHKFGKPVFTALLSEQSQPRATELVLNTPAYVVNLRLSTKSNHESLVIIRLSVGGRIEFIRK